MKESFRKSVHEKMFNKLRNGFKYGLVGLALAYNISCGNPNNDLIIINLENTQPVIITQTLEDAVAGEYYTKQIEVYDADNTALILSLINGPEGMTLEKNRINSQDIYMLNWSPPHSRLGPNFSKLGSFPVELSVTDTIATTTKTLDLLVSPNTTSLDYLRTDENIEFGCEAPCKTLQGHDVKDDYLDNKSIGVFNIYKLFKNTVQSDTPERYKPIVYRILKDSECIGDIIYTSFTQDGKRRLICDKKNSDANGNIIEINPDYKPDEKYNNYVAAHEGCHDILNYSPSNTNFQESFCTSIGLILSKGSGNSSLREISSLCDYNPGYYLPLNIHMHLAYDLCQYYSFDMKDLPTMFNQLRTIDSATVQQAKCIIDGIVATNTWQAFYESGILEVIPYDYYCGD